MSLFFFSVNWTIFCQRLFRFIQWRGRWSVEALAYFRVALKKNKNMITFSNACFLPFKCFEHLRQCHCQSKISSAFTMCITNVCMHESDMLSIILLMLFFLVLGNVCLVPFSSLPSFSVSIVHGNISENEKKNNNCFWLRNRFPKLWVTCVNVFHVFELSLKK